MDLHQKFKVKQQTVEAVVHRGDGTVENLGVISYWHRNPFKHWWWKWQQFAKKWRR